MALKYLFHALYQDGTIFSQNPEDVSATNAEKSAFYDVVQDQVVRFCLEGEGHTAIVDLSDGHFEIDDVVFTIEPVPADTKLRLIFVRRHLHRFNVEMEELAHEMTYVLGWQYTDADGKNHQQTISLS